MYPRFTLSFIGAAAVAVSLTVSANVAQAACYTPQQAVSPQEISSFLGNPGRILQQHAAGGPELITQVRDLVASDPSTLAPILGLLSNASKEQKTAIGSGLAQAAKICVRPDQEYASRIQQAVAESKDQDVVVAYAAVTGEQPTAAIGGAPSGGASGGQTNPLGGGPVGGGSAQPIGGPGTATFAFTYPAGVVGTGASSGTTGTTTAATPQSP